MATNGATSAATPVAAAPAAAAPTPTSSPASSSPGAGPASSHAPVQDGQRGAGALTPDQSVDAMVAAVQAKQGESPAPAAADASAVPENQGADGAQTDGTQTEGEKKEGEDAAGADQQTQGEDEYSFDEEGFTGARDLAAKIDANPALKAALGDELRDELMANARIAETLAPYRNLFGSPQEAEVVVKSATEFAGLQQIFGSIHGDNIGKGTSDLVMKMLEMSARRDDEGNPMKRQDGSYITDGTTTNFLNELFNRKLNSEKTLVISPAVEKKIKESGDDAAIAALDLVMERAGLRASTAGKDQADDPALAARRAELDRQQAALETEKRTQRQERERQYNESLNTALQGTTDGAIESILKNATGLNDFTKKTVVRELTTAIKAAIRKNAAYLAQKDQIELRPLGQARHNAEVRLAKEFLRDNLVRIARPIFANAGITITKKAGEKASAQAARAEAARGDVQGSAPASAQPASAKQDPTAAWNATRDALKAKLGREPSTSEVNVEMMLNLPALKGRGSRAA